MRFDYGFIEDSLGSDGEPIDCYLGPNENAAFVYVVHQLAAQRAHISDMAQAIHAQVAEHPGDVVALWRSESSDAALRFLDRLPTSIG